MSLLAIDAVAAATFPAAAVSRTAGRQPVFSASLTGVPSPQAPSRTSAADAGEALLQFETAQWPISPPVADSALTVPMTVAQDYFPVGELDVPPQPLDAVRLPEIDADSGAAPPRLVLVVYVDATGVVEKTEVESSNLPSPIQDAAVAAFRDARFSPGQKNGHKTGSRVRIEVAYE